MFFFELCICTVLQLSVVDFDSDAASFQFILAVFVTIALLAFIGFVIALFFRFRGPKIHGFYEKWTILQSLWGMRPRDCEFNGQIYLAENRIKKQKARLLSQAVNKFGLGLTKWCRCEFLVRSGGESKTKTKDTRVLHFSEPDDWPFDKESVGV